MMKLDITVSSAALVYEKKHLKKALRQIGNVVARKARTMIRGQSSSKPGQPPMSRTGALAASIKVRPSKSGESVSVRDTKYYALFLEAGAVGGGGKKKTGRSKRGKAATKRILEARPFLSAALEQTESSITNKLKAAVTQDLVIKKK